MVAQQWVEVFRKTAQKYHRNKIDISKDAVSIPGISMKFVLNKSLE